MILGLRLRNLALLALVSGGSALDWTATPFNPPAVPLAVRTPYLSCWLPQGAGTALSEAWPTFWTGGILGWAGFVRVDGVGFNFLGAPSVPGATFTHAVQKSLTFTSTQSEFVMSAGPVDLTVNFLSPVEPKDLLRQSLPLSYLTVSAVSTDGGSHSVEIYTDISAEWISGDDSLTANWSTTVGDIITHQVQLVDQTVFGEVSDRIQQGSAFYSINNSAGTTFQTGQDIVVRAQFVNDGTLSNTQDTNFRAVSDDWPVFAFAVDLGTVSTTATEPTVFSIGHFRDPAVEYIIANDGTQARHLFFLTEFETPTDAIAFFMDDYNNAVAAANAFDQQVRTDASKISSEYADLVSLAIRQGLASMEITVSQNADGSFNASDILVFMKEISSDGNVNTVDVIFPSWPLLLYTNPALGRYLLEGLFRYQATGQWPELFSIHDLGSSYPKALGHNDGNAEAMPVEESGNMLIMTLSYFRATGDSFLHETFSDLLDQWTQFLIADSLIPANQLSTDDFAGTLANQTNLAIKGIVGIKAMSVIAGLLGDSAKEANYSSIVSSYVSQFMGFAQSTTGPHLTLAYNNDSSWGLSYNMLGDKLLDLGVFPQSLYDQQTAWYKTVDNEFGVPLDTRHTYTLSVWEIWTAAIMSDTAARDMFVSAVRGYAADGLNNAPMSDWFDTVSGVVQGFRARPVVGGHLALLVV